jgi:hypothetical protein
MPSRPIVVLILVGWFATLAWFCRRELGPILFPADAPPFAIDLGDEVTSQMAGEVRRPDVLWGIYRDTERIGRAETRLRYFVDDDTFELETRIVNLHFNRGIVEVKIPELITAYRIDRLGELRRFRFNGSLALPLFRADASIQGEVRDGKLWRSGTVDIPGFMGKVTPEFDVVDAPRGGVLNPMHPIPKLKDIRPGGTWRMPLMNPLDDAMQPVAQSLLNFGQNPDKPLAFKMPQRPTHVDAEVLTEPRNVTFNGQDHECWVIEFRGLSEPARTFVRIRDGAVLRQEAEKFVMQRE